MLGDDDKMNFFEFYRKFCGEEAYIAKPVYKRWKENGEKKKVIQN